MTLALITGLAAGSTSFAQETTASLSVIVIDKERVLRESDLAARLAEQETAARSLLQTKLNALSEEIETEESTIAALRAQVDKETFEERVRAFNDKVQEARRTFQQESEAIQRRFARARQQAAAALDPVLTEIMDDEGADLVVDSRFVLAARSGTDRSALAIERFNTATKELFVSPDALIGDE